MKLTTGADFERSVKALLNNGLTFDDNFHGGFVDVTLPGTPSTDLEVHHGLGYVPTGFLIVRKDGAGDVYASNISNWDSEFLYIASDTASLDVRLFVF